MLVTSLQPRWILTGPSHVHIAKQGKVYAIVSVLCLQNSKLLDGFVRHLGKGVVQKNHSPSPKCFMATEEHHFQYSPFSCETAHKSIIGARNSASSHSMVIQSSRHALANCEYSFQVQTMTIDLSNLHNFISRRWTLHCKKDKFIGYCLCAFSCKSS